ncbi:hypothetical protein J3459_007467 [Metarhizium acridum]|nr:hypothetical protein J3459_007467 [Metarhizium acridum]
MHLRNLAKIFVKYDVHSRLGVHLIHGHSKLATGTVMLRHILTEPSGYWTKPVTIEELDLATVQGHIFKLVAGDRFVAYEYTERRVNDVSDISFDFIRELVDYLRFNSLEGAVGLQILGQDAGKMVEFDLGDCRTAMLRDQDTPRGPFQNHRVGFYIRRGDNLIQGPRNACTDGQRASQGLDRRETRTKHSCSSGYIEEVWRYQLGRL